MVYPITIKTSNQADVTFQLFELNKDILDNILYTFYTQHPETDFIDAEFRLSTESKMTSHIVLHLSTHFYVPIINQKNKRHKINVQWSTNTRTYKPTKMFTQMEVSKTEPEVICLENMWYKATS